MSVRTDITDLKNTQRRLEDSEHTFRTLLETAPIPLVLAADGRYLYANQKTHDLLGVEMGELVGRKTQDFYADPNDYTEAMSLLTKDERIERFEVELQQYNGDRLWVVVSSAPINFEGQPAIFAGMLDITAHKRAEQELLESERRFRAIAKSSPIPMLITRQIDGLILYANEHVEVMLGCVEEGVLGRKIEDFYEDPASREGRAAAVREKGYLDRVIMEMRRTDGSLVPTIHSLRTIEFDGVPAIVGAFMDITEQQKNELELRRARDKAEDANASKTQFLAVMSHELRTPLNAIIGFSDMMQQEIFGPMGHERYSGYATDIFQSGKHLSELLSDILDLSRIEAGHLDRDETVFDLGEVIGDCIGFVRGPATEYGVAVRLSLPDPCPRLKADKRQLKQILLNLLTNAVKFTGSGTAVHLDVEVAASGDLTLRIKEQGAGIPDDDLERIMEPFTRLASHHTSGVEGTGLGLAIAKRLVEGHGGSLELVSELGRGTEAIVTIPAARVQGQY